MCEAGMYHFSAAKAFELIVVNIMTYFLCCSDSHPSHLMKGASSGLSVKETPADDHQLDKSAKDVTTTAQC